ncbi:hypothetical protein A7X81_00965 [Campylobacter ornithocola]|uniref:Uncharacterized protein n=1 Tax=Campylobacter ornithocola TaxID=1848766 RepID=A0A6M8N4D6_9BACT|nr:hypothetical protein A7X81_00965 [Campylobacter ornithocola]QKF57891.1 hypothetical protein CORN_1388 [Campylobacter ornithocola]
MEKIQEFFKNIDRDDIDKTSKNLVSKGLIDSIDIISLVREIESYYKKPLKANFINEENFEDFESIQKMITQSYEINSSKDMGGGIQLLSLNTTTQFIQIKI